MSEARSTKLKRNPNIELLRILAMIGVVILHINNPIFGNCLAYAGGSPLYIILLILECSFTCAVDIFVCITGYFMANKMSVNIKKPLLLLIQVCFFRVLCYGLDMVINGTFSAKTLILSFLPKNYFVVLYCTLYILSPYINKMINAISIKNHFKLLIVLFTLFSVIPTGLNIIEEFTPVATSGLDPVGAYGNGFGYTVVNFIMMYIFGAYLRRREDLPYKTGALIAIILACTAVDTIWCNCGTDFSLSSSLSHNNPLVIITALCWFIIFRRITIESEGIGNTVNFLAKGTFTVFLCHTMILSYIPFERIISMLGTAFGIVVLGIAAIVYLMCAVLYLAYSASVEKIVKMLISKIRFLDRLCIDLE